MTVSGVNSPYAISLAAVMFSILDHHLRSSGARRHLVDDLEQLPG